MLNFLGYEALSLKKLKPYLDGHKNGKVVGITFDDGYLNNLINAAPVLAKYNFSATCYLVNKKIGLSNTWDLEKGITQSPLMNEDEINEWLNLGMDIGAHTNTHPDLTSISEKKALKEIKDCKDDLSKKFNVNVKDFCYPFGLYNKLICNMAKDSGYLSATTMIRGRASSKSDRYLLPRIPINHRTLPLLFLAKILTRYEDRRK